MIELRIRLPDEAYYELVGMAAGERRDIDEFARQKLLDLVDGGDEDDLPFEERVIEAFNLEPGSATAANVIGVAERMREGMSWTEAYKDRAKEYAESNPTVDSAEKYRDTVRDACTRRLGLSTNEFRERVARLIRGDGSGDPTPRPRSVGGGSGGSLEVRLVDGEGNEAIFGQDPSLDQSQVMKTVIDHLIVEYDLIDRISIPYVIRKKALINDKPTYPDGQERMRHFKELLGGYYLDTHYSREDKRLRMEDLAEICGLDIEFGDGWYR